MGMKGNNFFHMVLVGTAIAPQSVNNDTVDGATISEPWKKGRQLVFFAMGGAFAATVDGVLKVQGLLRSDGTTWEDVQTPASTPVDLEFDQTILDDAGGLENGAYIGTLDLSSFDGETYEAVRLQYIESGSAAALIAVGYMIFDLYDHPSGTVDQLWSKQKNR